MVFADISAQMKMVLGLGLSVEAVILE